MVTESLSSLQHYYSIPQVSKVVYCSLVIFTVLQLTTIAGTEPTPPQLGLLHLVGPVTVSTTQLLQQVSLTIPSTHDYEDYTNILTDIKTIKNKLTAIPALENSTVFYKSIGQ